MAIVEAIVAGTGVLPSYGQALLDEHDLERLADALLKSNIPMFTEHDLDQPIDARVIRTEIRDGADGDRQLFVEYEVPDEQVGVFRSVRGMSIGFTKWLVGPAETEPDVRLAIDPAHFNQFELALAIQRLDRGGFTPAGGFYFQLALEPPPTVVFEFLLVAVQQIGWNVAANLIYDGLKVLLHRHHKTRFRFYIKSDHVGVTAEISTSSEAGLKAGLKALQQLDYQNGGMFVRHASRWRKAGTGRAKAGRKRAIGNRKASR